MANQQQRPPRILIIEDNDGDVMLLREALRTAKLACEVVAFSNGEEALQHVRDAATLESAPKPDAVLLDMHLPMLEGTAVLEVMRASPFLEKTPVIALSSAISTQDRKQMQPFNVARYLIKPSDLDEYLKIGEVVRDVLRGSTDETPEGV
jgi:CheY-like chemotaxis protein